MVKIGFHYLLKKYLDDYYITEIKERKVNK